MSHRWNSPFINSYWIKVLESFSILHFIKSEILFFGSDLGRDGLRLPQSHQTIDSVILIFFSLELKKIKKNLSFCTFARKKVDKNTNDSSTIPQTLKNTFD